MAEALHYTAASSGSPLCVMMGTQARNHELDQKRKDLKSRKISRVRVHSIPSFIQDVFTECILCVHQAMFFVLIRAVKKTENILAFISLSSRWENRQYLIYIQTETILDNDSCFYSGSYGIHWRVPSTGMT